MTHEQLDQLRNTLQRLNTIVESGQPVETEERLEVRQQVKLAAATIMRLSVEIEENA